MTAPKKRGGARLNTGPKTDRPISRKKPVYLFKDQSSVTPEEVRAAVDQFLKQFKIENNG